MKQLILVVRLFALVFLLAALTDSVYSAAPVQQLNQTFASSGAVESFLLTPDQQTVVFLADSDGNFREELYSVPIDGSTNPVRLDAPTVDGGIDDYVISADGAYVIYSAEHTTLARNNLYRVSIAGGAILRLDSNVAQSNISSFKVNSLSSHVVFSIEAFFAGQVDLYSVGINGGAASKLHAGNENIFDNFNIAADGTRVVYMRKDETATYPDIYSVPIDASAGSVLLNSGLSAQIASFQITADSQTVVFRIDGRLYQADIDGSGNPVQLDADARVEGRVATYRLSNDSSYAVFYASDPTDESFVEQLYSVALSGRATPVQLTNFTNATQFIPPFNYYIAPNSGRVAYIADTSGGTADELYSIPIGGGSLQTIASPASNGQAVDAGGEVQFTSDGNYLIYALDTAAANVYIAAVDGSGSPQMLTNSSGSDDDIADFSVTANDRYLLYRSDATTNFQYDLFAVSLTGGSPIALSNATTGPFVTDYRATDDSSCALFISRQAGIAPSNLFAADLDGVCGVDVVTAVRVGSSTAERGSSAVALMALLLLMTITLPIWRKPN